MSTGTQSGQQSKKYSIKELIIALGRRIKTQLDVLQGIAISLQEIQLTMNHLIDAVEPAPNHQRPLSEYDGFDWASIDAVVLKSDRDGVTEVEWHGFKFTRRSPTNNYDTAIWFSRYLGIGANGQKKYACLISFKDKRDPRPIAEDARRVQPQRTTR